ncbi:MAG: hypothetical protein RIS64_4154 [Bacteroidota bacterium]
MDINWKKTLFWTIGITGTAYGAWTGYNYYNMSKGGLQVGNPKLSVKNFTLHVSLPITNVTASSITVTGITGGLKIDGKHIIDLVETKSIEIVAHSTTTVPFEVSPNWIGLAITVGTEVINKVKTGKFSDLKAKIDGNVFISNIRIPFSTAVV